MWSRINLLLGISVKKEDYTAHVDNCLATTGWIQQSYPRITIEEILQAYDLACSQQLKIKELFSIICPKHVGIVLGAYANYTQDNLEINQVFRQQLLEEPPQQTPEQINRFMESALQEATEQVRLGKFYYDAGNGVFDWLWSQGRIELTDPQKIEYWNRAVRALPKLLQRERAGVTAGDTGRLGKISKLLEEAEQQKYGGDHNLRVEAHAKRLALNDYLKSRL